MTCPHGISKKAMSGQGQKVDIADRAGPLRGRIRLRDELRYRFARCAPGSLIQSVEILPDRSTRPGNGLPVHLVRPSGRTLLIGVSGNQAGIDRKSAPVDQPFCHAAADHGLEQFAQQIAIAEAAPKNSRVVALAPPPRTVRLPSRNRRGRPSQLRRTDLAREKSSMPRHRAFNGGTLFDRRVHSDYRRARSRRPLTRCFDGKSIASLISSLRLVFESRYVEPF
jgi:NAD(P)-dependent dehydrogenase (short-subunit alcohol dehydrogenase family)